MSKVLTSKKGVDEFIAFIIFVLFITVAVFFIVFPTLKGGKTSTTLVDEQQSVIEGYKNLLDYVRTPIQHPIARNIGELISASYLNNDYDDLRTYTLDFFNERYETRTSSWKLVFKVMPKNEELDIFYDYEQRTFGKITALATVRVPLHEQKGSRERFIEITLFKILLIP